MKICQTHWDMLREAIDAPCPLCRKNELEANCTLPNCNKQTGDDWVQFATNDQLEEARQRGLIPLPS